MPENDHPSRTPAVRSVYESASMLRDYADALEARVEGDRTAWTDAHALGLHRLAVYVTDQLAAVTALEQARRRRATVVPLDRRRAYPTHTVDDLPPEARDRIFLRVQAGELGVGALLAAPRTCARCGQKVARYGDGWAHTGPGNGDHEPELS